MKANKRWTIDTDPKGVASPARTSETEAGGHDHNSVAADRKAATVNVITGRQSDPEPSYGAADFESFTKQ